MRSLVGIAVLAFSAAGCGSPPSATEGAAPPPSPKAGHGGSLILEQDAAVAWIADADNRAIHRVDLVSLEVSTTPLDGAPEQLVLLGDGRIAATVRDRNRVEVLETGPTGRRE